jgi:nitrous oxidase accessory protein
MNRFHVAVVGLACAAGLVPVSPARATPLDAAPASFDDLARLVADPAGPSVIALRPGVYRGDLEVRRPLVLRGQPGVTLEGTGTTTVLTIDASDVTVEGILVRHSGRRSTTEDAAIKAKGERVRVRDVHIEDALFGATLGACHHCELERVQVDGARDASELMGDAIKLWEADDSVVRGCRVDGSRDVVVWYTRRALVEDNVIRHGRYGTHFMYAHDAVARRNRLEDDVVGIFVMYSLRLDVEDNVLAGARGPAGMGIGFKESDAVHVHGNWLVANTTGTYLDYSPRTRDPDQAVTFDGNVFALNDVALRLHSIEKGVVLHGNDFRGNGETVEVDGGGDALGCDVRGNHFDGYEGYDLDRDGVGDVPHRVSALSSELGDEHPALRFFAGTTAMHLVDAIARAVPVFDRRTLLTDPAPLMNAPAVREP